MNTAPVPYDAQRLSELAQLLIDNIRELAQAGWTPATSSNFSHRLDERHAAITVSGKDKGRLIESDIMVVDFDGKAVGRPLRPSAETLLHTHSPVQTIASRLYGEQGHIRLEGYELLKALHGNSTHETAVDLKVFANTQDMDVLAAQVEAELDKGPMWGYLIDGHGLYAWGRDMAQARRHLEAFEFLLGCELELRKLGAHR